MLNDWDKRFPGRIDIMFRSLQNVVPSHLLDGQLFNFKALDRSFGVVDGGDIAFDKPDFSQPTLDFERRSSTSASSFPRMVSTTLISVLT